MTDFLDRLNQTIAKHRTFVEAAEAEEKARLKEFHKSLFSPLVESPGEVEMFEGHLMRVVDASKSGWWRYHEHYDRNGYCDNPARGY